MLSGDRSPAQLSRDRHSSSTSRGVSASDLASINTDDRAHPMSAGAERHPRQPDHLRTLFAEVSHRLRELADHPRFNEPAAAPLRQASTRVVPVLKTVYIRLHNRAEATTAPPADTTEGGDSQRLAELLTQARTLLHNTHWQLERIGWLQATAEHLRDFLDQLRQQAEISARDLREVVGQVLQNTAEATHPDHLLTAPDLPLELWLPVRRLRTEPAVLGTGLEAAVLTAWVTLHFREWELEQESLVAAALLQDIGLLNLELRFPLAPRQLEQQYPRAYRRHPQYSAALAAGIQQLSARVPLLIAEHHPDATSSGHSSLSPGSGSPQEIQLLQVIVRLLQLRRTSAETAAAAAAKADSPRAAATCLSAIDASGGLPQLVSRELAAQLQRETDTSSLNADICTTVLACFDEPHALTRLRDSSQAADRLQNGPAASAKPPRPVRIPLLTEFGRQRLRLDTAHGELQEPHFALAGNQQPSRGFPAAATTRFERTTDGR